MALPATTKDRPLVEHHQPLQTAEGRRNAAEMRTAERPLPPQPRRHHLHLRLRQHPPVEILILPPRRQTLLIPLMEPEDRHRLPPPQLHRHRRMRQMLRWMRHTSTLSGRREKEPLNPYTLSPSRRRISPSAAQRRRRHHTQQEAEEEAEE